MSDDWKDFLGSVKPISINRRNGVIETTEEAEIIKRPSYEVKVESEVEIPSKIGKKNDSLGFLEASDFSRIDKTHIKNLNKGNFLPEATIDLHGYRLHEAEEEFFNFIEDSYQQNRRYILVVTGKSGLGEGGISVIKQSIPKWLNSSPLADKILAYSLANRKHGGDGAYYILLKK